MSDKNNPAELTRWQRRRIQRAAKWVDTTSKDQHGIVRHSNRPDQRRAFRTQRKQVGDR
jgi:hypothetical protein